MMRLGFGVRRTYGPRRWGEEKRKIKKKPRLVYIDRDSFCYVISHESANRLGIGGKMVDWVCRVEGDD
jgi:hypothetical protein